MKWMSKPIGKWTITGIYICRERFVYCRVQSSLAGALIKLNHFPPKMNPLIRPLMESIKKEENAQLQVQK